ncbi:hypothetical protein, partial [Parafrankia sp. FMc2]|uniref:hypothetical protein n=1 Tax=Parafrankia sp. FMc2 TaxID=3233196 RepID=UPI0034D46DE7
MTFLSVVRTTRDVSPPARGRPSRRRGVARSGMFAGAVAGAASLLVAAAPGVVADTHLRAQENREDIGGRIRLENK